MKAIVEEAYVEMGKAFTSHDEAVWGGSFEVSNDDIAKDVRSLAAAHGDLDEIVRNRKKEMEHDRLSVDRVHRYISDDNPEKTRMLLLAGESMPVTTDPRFTPYGGGIAPAVNKLLFEGFHAKGLAFIFPKDVVKSYITAFHGSPLGWTSKDQKESGRPIGDCSDGGKQPGNFPLNSD
jgi:hypothetical protein